jgi:hypothetical protein
MTGEISKDPTAISDLPTVLLLQTPAGSYDLATADLITHRHAQCYPEPAHCGSEAVLTLFAPNPTSAP